MLSLKHLLVVGAAVAGLAGAAKADTVYRQVWVEGHNETRMQRVEEPGRWVDEQKVVEVGGRYEMRQQLVAVPGRYDTVERKVWVPATEVAARGARLAVGVGPIAIGVRLPCTEVVPAHWETRCEQVWCAPRNEMRTVQVWVPGEKHVETVRVWHPGACVDRPVVVWVPGHYDTCAVDRCVEPRVSVGIGFGIGVGIGHRHW